MISITVISKLRTHVNVNIIIVTSKGCVCIYYMINKKATSLHSSVTLGIMF